MIDLFIKFFLFMSHDSMIIPLIILGFIWINKEVFYHSIYVLLISMIFSYALKAYFKIESSSYGLIFPSGHMLCSTALYGWIAYKLNNIIIRILSLCLLTGIAISLVYSGYHNYYDVVAGSFFAIILLILYDYILHNKADSIITINLLFISIAMTYIYFTIDKLFPHLWLAYYTFIGFSFSAKIFNNSDILITKFEKTFTTLSFFLSMYLINYLFSFLKAPDYIFQLKWLLIGFSLPFYCFFVKKFNYQNIQFIK